jgi:hypothetical protein
MGIRLYKVTMMMVPVMTFSGQNLVKIFLIEEIEADECDCGKGFQIILNYDKCK